MSDGRNESTPFVHVIAYETHGMEEVLRQTTPNCAVGIQEGKEQDEGRINNEGRREMFAICRYITSYLRISVGRCPRVGIDQHLDT